MSVVFPEQEPEVLIEPLDDGLTEVLCRDTLGGFVELEVGATCDWSFYDWPERVLTVVTHSRVVGRVLLNGLECLDVRHREDPGEGEESRSLLRVTDDQLHHLQMEMTWAGGIRKIEQVDATPAPLRLRLGDRWSGHERYICGEKIRGGDGLQYRLVDGAFRVRVAGNEFRCLRQTWWELNAADAGVILAELYVADCGRSVFWQRYNGPAWRNYEALGGTPEREHEGVTYRLWYDCIPDVALAG